MFHSVGDGSTALFYEKSKIVEDPKEMARIVLEGSKGYTMLGWEPGRMENLESLFAAYAHVTKEDLWNNLKYFLEAIMPVCEELDIKMAIHQDDPPWDIFGLPRLLVDEVSVLRFLNLVNHPCNCLTLCSGSLGANPNNNVADIIRKTHERIAFAHIRNVKHFPNGDFIEASHPIRMAMWVFLKFYAPTTMWIFRAIFVLIMDAISGVKNAARAMGCMTERWA